MCLFNHNNTRYPANLVKDHDMEPNYPYNYRPRGATVAPHACIYALRYGKLTNLRTLISR